MKSVLLKLESTPVSAFKPLPRTILDKSADKPLHWSQSQALSWTPF